VQVIDWQKHPDAESRLTALKTQDREVVSLSRELHMRHELSLLEAENAHLRIQVEEYETWKASSTFRVARAITRSLSPFKRMFKGN
jgi:hypothetical protein